MRWISVGIGEDAIFPRLERRPMPKQGYRGWFMVRMLLSHPFDADMAIKAFNEYVAAIVLENEGLEGVQTGLLELSIADTGEEHEKDEEHSV